MVCFGTEALRNGVTADPRVFLGVAVALAVHEGPMGLCCDFTPGVRGVLIRWLCQAGRCIVSPSTALSHDDHFGMYGVGHILSTLVDIVGTWSIVAFACCLRVIKKWARCVLPKESAELRASVARGCLLCLQVDGAQAPRSWQARGEQP